MGTAAVVVQTSYYWPSTPTGIVVGYTAPLAAWEETTISGLTSTPIVLHSSWSQSTRPEHHNFGADYIFEPRLEPGLDAAILAELEAADIQMIYANESGQVYLIGLDGTFREL